MKIIKVCILGICAFLASCAKPAPVHHSKGCDFIQQPDVFIKHNEKDIRTFTRTLVQDNIRQSIEMVKFSRRTETGTLIDTYNKMNEYQKDKQEIDESVYLLSVLLYNELMHRKHCKGGEDYYDIFGEGINPDIKEYIDNLYPLKNI